MTIHPIGDNLIIEPLDDIALRASASGLVIADTMGKDKPNQGTVLAVGEGRAANFKAPIKTGDKVLYTKYGGTDFEFEGKKLLVLSVDDIICHYRD